MRSCKSLTLPIAFFTLVMLLLPRPAHAWFAWMDYLSGPEPFKSGYPGSLQGVTGGTFDVQILCFMQPTSRSEAELASQTAASLTKALLGQGGIPTKLVEFAVDRLKN